MRSELFLGMLIFSLSGWAGNPLKIDSLETDNHISHVVSVDVSYLRAHLWVKDDFSSHFQETYQSNFGNELQGFGLGFTAPLVISTLSHPSGEHFDANFGLNYWFCPNLNSGDTAYFEFHKTDFHFAIGRDLIDRWDRLDIGFRLGTNWGMALLRVNDQRSRNPYFNLIAQIQPRIVIWKFSLSAILEGGFDITSGKWKPKKRDLNNYAQFKNNYWLVSFNLGFVLYD